MSNGRHINWELNKDASGNFLTSTATLGVLMDIRDELEKLNRVFKCSNFISIPRVLKCSNFISIPRVLRISANTAKPRKKKR
jgi:hypothetical protein